MKPALPLPVPLALLLLLHLAARSATEAPSPLPVQCTVNLVAMSSCLPHLAALPENATSTPSAACCQAFAAAIDGAGGGASCLCDLVRRPFLLGYRLDASRLVALLSSCWKSVSVEVSSFDEICQGSGKTRDAGDFEAESGSVGPDRRGGGGRQPKSPKPSPSPLQRNPISSPLWVEPELNPASDGPPPESKSKPEPQSVLEAPPPPASGADAFPSTDDFDDESGSTSPDRRRGGGRRSKPPRSSPSPRRPNPTPSPPRAEPGPNPAPDVPPPGSETPPPPGSETPPPPGSETPPPPASGAGRPPSIPTVPTIPEDSADCRREKLFRGTVLFLLSIFALC